jgi:tetratricopeptide (TPR) repeat protein
MPLKHCLAAALLSVLCAAAHAETFHYRGDISVTAVSGAGCSGPKAYTVRDMDLVVRDDAPGTRYEGFVGGQGLSVRRFAGARLEDLSVTVAVADPKVASRFHLSLSALGGDALTGHTEAASVPAEMPGCYVDAADLNLSRVAGPAGDLLQRAATQFGLLQLQAQWAALWQENDYGAAVAVARQAEALAEQSFGATDARLVPTLVRLIATLMCSGNTPEAAALLRRAFALDGHTPARDYQILGELGRTTVAARKYAEAEALLRQAIALEEKATPPADLASYLSYLGILLQGTSRYADAEPVLRRAVHLDEQTLGPNDPQLAFALSQLGQDLMYTGKYAESEQLLGDGTHMTLAQIRTKLNFNSVELLTLSACDTALGGGATHHGVEVEGLGALAQEAGAKAVLATLWPVADESTSELMRALYQEHRDHHRDKADALREAQLDLIRGTVTSSTTAADSHRGLTRTDGDQAGGNFKADPKAPFSHPFYWAPFILMGNWL